MELMEPATERGGVRLPYRRYWAALYRRDVAAAERIVRDCLERHPPARIYLRLFEPALALSGTLWSTGRVHYRDEHFVTYHTVRFLRLARRAFVPPHPAGPLAFAASAGQESHVIGLRMVCDFVQAYLGWRVHWLASNDRGVVREAAARLRPDALLLSIGLGANLESARRLIADLRRQDFRGLVALGGAAVNYDPNIVPRLGGDLTADNGMHLVRLLRARGFSGIRRDVSDD